MLIANRGKKRDALLPRAKGRIFAGGLENLGDGLSCQDLLECPFCLAEVDGEGALDVPANQAFRIGLAVMHGEQMLFVNGPVDFQQCDGSRVAQQSPASAYTRLRSYQPVAAEQAEDATDEHACGIDAAGHGL